MPSTTDRLKKMMEQMYKNKNKYSADTIKRAEEQYKKETGSYFNKPTTTKKSTTSTKKNTITPKKIPKTTEDVYSARQDRIDNTFNSAEPHSKGKTVWETTSNGDKVLVDTSNGKVLQTVKKSTDNKLRDFSKPISKDNFAEVNIKSNNTSVNDPKYNELLNKFNELQNSFNNQSNLIQQSDDKYQEMLKKMYDAQKESQLSSLKQAKESALNSLQEQESYIKPRFEGARRSTITSSKRGAKSFGDFLASKGLNYSGVQTQGNIANNLSLNQNLGNLRQQEMDSINQIANSRNQINQEYINSQNQLENQINQGLLQNQLNRFGELEKRSYNEQQQNFQNEVNNINRYYNDFQAEINRRMAINPNDPLIPYLESARQQKIANMNNSAYEQQQDQYKKAYDLFRQIGYATPEIAQVLGIPTGTTTSSYSNQNSKKTSTKNYIDTKSYEGMFKDILNNKTKTNEYNEKVKDVEGAKKDIAKVIVTDYYKGNMSEKQLVNLVKKYNVPESVLKAYENILTNGQNFIKSDVNTKLQDFRNSLLRK